MYSPSHLAFLIPYFIWADVSLPHYSKSYMKKEGIENLKNRGQMINNVMVSDYAKTKEQVNCIRI